jgi:hypothetical protein
MASGVVMAASLIRLNDYETSIQEKFQSGKQPANLAWIQTVYLWPVPGRYCPDHLYVYGIKQRNRPMLEHRAAPKLIKPRVAANFV